MLSESALYKRHVDRLELKDTKGLDGKNGCKLLPWVTRARWHLFRTIFYRSSFEFGSCFWIFSCTSYLLKIRYFFNWRILSVQNAMPQADLNKEQCDLQPRNTYFEWSLSAPAQKLGSRPIRRTDHAWAACLGFPSNWLNCAAHTHSQPFFGSFYPKAAEDGAETWGPIHRWRYVHAEQQRK